MKINFSKKEYETLLEILYIANWVIDAFETEPKPDKQKYEDLEQKILSYAKDFGMDRLVVWDARVSEYFHSKEFDDGRPMELIEEFEDESFWNELTHRLAERDFIETHTEEEIEKMDVWDRIRKIDEFVEKYWDEFEENGLENLRIDKK